MKTIIFDMYGVIIKSPEGDLVPFIQTYFPHATADSVNKLWKEAAVGAMTSYDFFREVGFTDHIADIEKQYLDTIEIDDNFLTIASYFKKDYKLVLLSNDISEWSTYLRNRFCLNELFDFVIISGDYGVLKPDVKLFHIILDSIDTEASECLYIDDREKNINLALQLGMKAILFNRRNIQYSGYSINSFHELITYMINIK